MVTRTMTALLSTTGVPNRLGTAGLEDSHDSVFHADGSLAEGPIALCEVQAYVYAAKLESPAWPRLGYGERANELQRQAELLQERFESSFWSERVLRHMRSPWMARSASAA